MIKSLTLITLLVATTVTVTAATYEEYQEKSPRAYWEAKGGIGYSKPGAILANATTNNPIPLSSPPATANSSLVETSASASPLIYLNVQRTFVLDQAPLYALSFGVSFYYQQLQSTGNVFLKTVDAPITPTATYTFTSKQMLPMLEVQWTPVLLWRCLAPFIVVGAGVDYANNVFTVTVLPDGADQAVPGNTTAKQFGLAADLGLGVNLMFNENWGMDLRYVYIKSFSQTLSGAISTTPVPFSSSTNNILLSGIYRFGIVH